MLSDFLTHLKDYIHNNRARLAKILFYLALIVAAALLIYAVVDEIQRAKYERRVNQLDQQFKEAEAKAQAHEQAAEALKNALQIKEVEYARLEAEGHAADKRMVQTRTVYVQAKENYEQVRATPIPSGPVSCADVCAELERLGYPCR